MKTRLITAAVGVPFLIFTLVVRGWFAEFVIVALTFIAMYETYRALKKAGYAVCEWGGYVATAAMWPLSRLMGVLDPLLLLVAAMGVSMTPSSCTCISPSVLPKPLSTKAAATGL